MMGFTSDALINLHQLLAALPMVRTRLRTPCTRHLSVVFDPSVLRGSGRISGRLLAVPRWLGEGLAQRIELLMRHWTRSGARRRRSVLAAGGSEKTLFQHFDTARSEQCSKRPIDINPVGECEAK